MAKELILRRGTTTQHSTFRGKNGEVTVDTDKKTVVVHDNITAGGTPLAKESTLTAHTSDTSNPHNVTKTQIGLENVDNTSDKLKPLSDATIFELAKKINISDIQNNLSSNETTKPLSAYQGKVLKGLIDNINALLTSDESNLDTLQEIVDYIQLNRATLSALSISSIAGLQTALNNKLAINEKAQSASIADSATTAGTCSGNAATATKLATARTISLSGAVTGSGSFDGSANISISTTINVSTSIASLSAGAVGTYALARNNDDAYCTFGSTKAGSSLRTTDVNMNGSGSTLSGTWRCMGQASSNIATLWLRIA